MPRPPAVRSIGSSAALAKLREMLAELRGGYRGGDTSYRAIARRTPQQVRHTTVSDVLRCDKPPTWFALSQVVIALGGDPKAFDALYAAATQTERVDAQTSGPTAHIQVAAEAWIPILERDGVSEGLLRGLPVRDVSKDLAPMDDFLGRSLPAIAVEVRTAHQVRTFRVESVRRFWTVMLVDSILHGGPVGLRRWLFRETDTVLRKERVFLPHMSDVWQWMFDTYLHSAAGPDAAGLLETFVDEAINESGVDHNRLYRTFDFLLDIAAKDPASVRLIRKALERHDHALRDTNTGPAMLARVRALMGEADHRLYDHGVDDRRFRPDLAPFSDGEICRYEFRAMRYPLMVGDVDLILRRPPSQGSTRPFVLAHEPGADSAFGELWREITHIVNSVPRHEEGEDWRWDIPTVAEWLTLAGCLDQPYPWGHEPPTPKRANLKFDVTSRLSPVGTFIAGRSSAGVYDCCGGVNEIVRELPYRMFDSDGWFESAFRLAGGSYRTLPEGLSCQRFRRLTGRDRGTNLSTVGIRLIAYRESDEERRWSAMRDLRRRRQPRPIRAQHPFRDRGVPHVVRAT